MVVFMMSQNGVASMTVILGLHKITPVSMLVDKGQNFLENTKPVYGFQTKT